MFRQNFVRGIDKRSSSCNADIIMRFSLLAAVSTIVASPVKSSLTVILANNFNNRSFIMKRINSKLSLTCNLISESATQLSIPPVKPLLYVEQPEWINQIHFSKVEDKCLRVLLAVNGTRSRCRSAPRLGDSHRSNVRLWRVDVVYKMAYNCTACRILTAITANAGLLGCPRCGVLGALSRTRQTKNRDRRVVKRRALVKKLFSTVWTFFVKWEAPPLLRLNCHRIIAKVSSV